MNRMSTQGRAYGLLTIEDFSLLIEGDCREKGDVEVMENSISFSLCCDNFSVECDGLSNFHRVVGN